MREVSSSRKIELKHRLQVALDMPNLSQALRICRALPVPGVILEVGTPLLKARGTAATRAIKKESRGRMVIADMKTMDAAELEVKIAKEGGADGVTASTLAPQATLDKFGSACRALGMICVVDLLGYSGHSEELSRLPHEVDILVCHSGIDQGLDPATLRPRVQELRRVFADKIIAVAGGVTLETAGVLLGSGADILIVGRHITSSSNPRQRALELLRLLREH
ncbi:MAG TPA: orotidine 5'-phosphate decarboxylase / HUMPS family protein [Thermoproteota archaeon]|nr:orotidine 5'-phosphate decarboxylase / HUMPS family protein [Thermoproteota archaeon]